MANNLVLAYPLTLILKNCPIEIKDGEPTTTRPACLKDSLTQRGYPVDKVKVVWRGRGYTGTTLIIFDKGEHDLYHALSLARRFQESLRGLEHFQQNYVHDRLYGWLATTQDLYDQGVSTDNILRKWIDMGHTPQAVLLANAAVAARPPDNIVEVIRGTLNYKILMGGPPGSAIPVQLLDKVMAIFCGS